MMKKIVEVFRRSKRQDEQLEVTNKRLDNMIAQLNGEDDWFLKEIDNCVKECICEVERRSGKDRRRRGGGSVNATPV